MDWLDTEEKIDWLALEKKQRKNLGQRAVTLRFPVMALGIDGETEAEVIIEYTQDRNHPINPNKFVINIWIMEEGISLKFGVTTIYAPTIENEGLLEQTARILSVVSESEGMQEKLTKAIASLRKESIKHPEMIY